MVVVAVMFNLAVLLLFIQPFGAVVRRQADDTADASRP